MPRRLITTLLQRYWRITRALTLGAQGMVLDADGRVLLVRHTYRVGWFLPGGGVEKRESAAAALARELNEETGIALTAPPELFALYSNFAYFPGDHVALFLVRHWTQARRPQPNREIAEQRFFALEALPEDISEATRRRIGEVLLGWPRREEW